MDAETECPQFARTAGVRARTIWLSKFFLSRPKGDGAGWPRLSRNSRPIARKTETGERANERAPPQPFANAGWTRTVRMRAMPVPDNRKLSVTSAGRSAAPRWGCLPGRGEGGPLPCYRAGMARNRRPLGDRVVSAAERTLAAQQYVSPVDVLMGIGWLDPNSLTRWRQGQVPCLEEVLQSNLPRISEAMKLFRSWAEDKGLQPSERLKGKRQGQGLRRDRC